jgi:TP901 family phage tail tape measure protein
MANEWVVRVTADVKGVLDASRQIGQAGKQAGQQFKEGFSSGDQTITGLRGRLNELNQTLEKSVIGSKEFVAAQRQIAQAQAQVDAAMAGGATAMNGFSKAVEGVALQAAAFIGLYQAITFVGQAVTELDTAGAAVRTLGVNSKELSSALLGLSNELNNNVSQADLLKASYDVASSGFSSTAENVEILRASALGAKGGFAELGVVSEAVSGVINAYGLAAKDATAIVDSFIQTQNDGVITVAQYGEQIGNLASLAAAAGVSYQELNAAVAADTLKKVPIAQTFTGLRQALSSIIKPTEEAKALASQLGISFDFANLKAKGLGGILEEIKAKGGGTADKLAILFNIEGQTALQPILNDLETYNKLLDNQITKTGQAKAASEIASETIASGFNQVVNATKNLAGQVNTALPGASKQFSDLAKAISIAAKLAEIAGSNIGKVLATPVGEGLQKLLNPFRGLSELSRIPGLDKLLDGNKEINAELDKQKQAQAEITAKEKEKEVIAGQILGNKRSQNLADQVANENARKLAGAYSDLAKAQIDQQVKVSQAGINLGQALIGLEDSRFGIIRNRNTYELQQAQQRGASEGEINAIKRQGDEIDRAALTFKYNALVQQQELQRVLLALQQEQAQLDAGSAASSAKLDLERAVLDLKAAQLASDTVAAAKAEVEIQKAQLSLQAANTKLETLTKIQAVESLIAGVTNETAQNQIKAEAAAKNLALAADGTFKAARGTREQFNSYQDSFLTPLNQAKTFQGLVRDTGLQVEDTGEGYYKITGFIGDAAKATGQARSQTAGLASNMSNAADAARSFYNSLNAAAGLPPARFTGGPVDAGGTYRINDGPSGMSLGQESFLSASGALSLINRPMNSLWTAPSKGTVIPAHVTSRLKESGALGGAGVLRAGPDPAMAHLAMAVGNLSQEVAELRRKAWNVSVGVRGDGSSLKLQQTMQRIR